MGPTKHILIVDDDAATRTAVTLVLEGTGYRVASASDGREALDCLERMEPPDLILLDLMMPRMDGWEFREHQWRSSALASIPVVILSAAGDVPLHAAALRAVGCLEKPVEFEKLLATIRRHCPLTERTAN
jgi:CheY-like chemotaxis protein